MRTFTDNSGRAWSLTINVDAVRRVRAIAKVDLMQAIEGDLVQKLSSDPVLLCDVIYALAKPEADASSICDEAFGRAMAGDAIDRATTALLEELVDFFPRGRRQLLAKALQKLEKLQEMTLAAAMVHLDSDKLEKQMQAALREIEQSPTASEPGS